MYRICPWIAYDLPRDEEEYDLAVKVTDTFITGLQKIMMANSWRLELDSVFQRRQYFTIRIFSGKIFRMLNYFPQWRKKELVEDIMDWVIEFLANL